MNDRKSFVHVWSKDEALNAEADGASAAYAEFLKTGDVGVLPVATGAKVATFECALLSVRQVQDVKDRIRRDGSGAGALLACTYGLRGWSGYVGRFGDSPKAETRKVGGVVLLTDASLENMDPDLVDELGVRIFDESHLRPRSGQASP